MSNRNDLLRLVPLLEGDVAKLHKGIFQILGFRKSSALKSSLLKSIHSGSFNIKVKLLPDVESFELNLSVFNPLLAAFGIQTRFGSEKLLRKNKNHRFNRYLLFMYLRLKKHQNDSNKYWAISNQLIMFSHSYLAASIQATNKNLYRELPMYKLVKLMARINVLRGNLINSILKEKIRIGKVKPYEVMAHLIEYHRAYLPKGTTYRPLGVPTLAWRIYCNMWLTPLNGFISISPSQHGFIPGRGTLTAWNQVATEVLNARNIYEIDFQGCFPSITPDLAETGLKEKKLPKALLNFFYAMNWSKPRFPKDAFEMKLPELFVWQGAIPHVVSQFAKNCLQLGPHAMKDLGKRMFNLQERLKEEEARSDSLFKEKVDQVMRDNQATGQEIWPELGFSWAKHRGQKSAITPAQVSMKGNILNGLPQGSPLSPFFTVVYLEHFFKSLQPQFGTAIKYVAYADDVIFYSDNDRAFQTFLSWLPSLAQSKGLVLATDKSQVSRVKGVWKAEFLKFLGIKYIPSTDQIVSDTRKGGKLLYDLQELSYLDSDLTTGRFVPKNTHKFFYETFLRKLAEMPSLKASYFIAHNLLDFTDKRLLKRFLSLTSSQTNTYLRMTDPNKIYSALDKLQRIRNAIEEITPKTLDNTKAFSGTFAGLIMSRLYSGSKTVKAFDTESGSQDFILRYKTGSLCHIMVSKAGKNVITIHNGSSYACFELVQLSGAVKRNGTAPSYKVFARRSKLD